MTQKRFLVDYSVFKIQQSIWKGMESDYNKGNYYLKECKTHEGKNFILFITVSPVPKTALDM